MFRLNTLSNIIQIPFNLVNLHGKAKWANKSLNCANMVLNNKLMQLLLYENTASSLLYPILMGVLHNKVLVVVILAFI